ncbi:uncharacterized protein LOC110401213 [Numida meleagris]|uniref:uncharacterized protein LOC110401213 n=1 Tax=Numida meleagris TaxID=8996 RepID=UPI000B3DDAB1|nr:uncharacterized protein LOC110401213 [Numida meleagris]
MLLTKEAAPSSPGFFTPSPRCSAALTHHSQPLSATDPRPLSAHRAKPPPPPPPHDSNLTAAPARRAKPPAVLAAAPYSMAPPSAPYNMAASALSARCLPFRCLPSTAPTALGAVRLAMQQRPAGARPLCFERSPHSAFFRRKDGGRHLAEQGEWEAMPAAIGVVPYRLWENQSSRDEVAEWLRRWTANPLCSARAAHQRWLPVRCGRGRQPRASLPPPGAARGPRPAGREEP